MTTPTAAATSTRRSDVGKVTQRPAKGRQAGAGVGLFGAAGAIGLLAAALTTCFILARRSGR